MAAMVVFLGADPGHVRRDGVMVFVCHIFVSST